MLQFYRSAAYFSAKFSQMQALCRILLWIGPYEQRIAVRYVD
jgi:hypothetical protein